MPSLLGRIIIGYVLWGSVCGYVASLAAYYKNKSIPYWILALTFILSHAFIWPIFSMYVYYMTLKGAQDEARSDRR